MKEYHAIIERGAETVSRAIRDAAMCEPVNVFGIHGGAIVAMRESDGWPARDIAPKGFTRMKPAHNATWESIPYVDLYRALYDAGRRVPFFV